MNLLIKIIRHFIFKFIWDLKIKFFFLLKGRVDYIFLANPEADWYIDGYYNPQKKKRISWLILGGIITKNKKIGKGVIFFHLLTSREFLGDKKRSVEVLNEIEEIRKRLGAKKVALAGVMPTIFFQKQKLPQLSSFVDGKMGTVFAIISSFLVVKEHYVLQQPKIVIFGDGRIGKATREFLISQKEDVAGFDIKDNPKLLSTADIIINLASRGDALLQHERLLKSGVLVIDDTYPPQTRPPINGRLYKVVTKSDGVKFFPRLPGFEATWLPGCTVEAMVCSSVEYEILNQKQFNLEAKELGLYAPLLEIK